MGFPRISIRILLILPMVVIQKKGSHRQRRIYFLVVAFEEKKVRNQPENLLLISQNPLLFYRSERNCWCLAQPLVRKGADHPGIPAEGLCGISEQAA